jgi:hypothetical protein
LIVVVSSRYLKSLPIDRALEATIRSSYRRRIRHATVIRCGADPFTAAYSAIAALIGAP